MATGIAKRQGIGCLLWEPWKMDCWGTISIYPFGDISAYSKHDTIQRWCSGKATESRRLSGIVRISKGILAARERRMRGGIASMSSVEIWRWVCDVVCVLVSKGTESIWV